MIQNAVQFSAIIIQVCALIGCPPPDETTRNLLWDLFVTEFSDLNSSEFIHSFKMNLLGEFQDEHGDEFKKIHYQIFSGEFMAGVLNAYRLHRFKIIAELKEAEKSTRALPSSTEAQNKEAHKNILNQILDDFTNTKPLVFSIKYDILKEEGLINLTKEQRDDYKTKAKEMLRIKAVRDNDVKSIRELNNGGQKEYILSEAKCLAYRDFLKDKTNAEILANHLSQ